MTKKIMICLDLTEMDQALMRYARHLCEVLNTIEEAVFVHNIKFDYPEEAESLMEELDRPLSELISEEIKEKARQHFESESTPASWSVEVTNEAYTAQALAGLASQKNIGLVVCGKKISYRGTGRVAEKILRLSSFKGDLLTVPETAPHRMERLLVPVDFSPHSVKALALANKIASGPAAKTTCQHVYTIPMHYFPFIPVQGFRKSMEEQARKDFDKFRKELPEELRGIPCEFTYSKDRTIAQTVYDFAINNNEDLIIIGSRGRSGLPAALLGSTAIQLMQFDFHVPLLVVR
ncbi:MAG: universal stress protein [Lewinellaceae bacterium]|nr:universal stress protein [Lewinellaceae bacterium]